MATNVKCEELSSGSNLSSKREMEEDVERLTCMNKKSLSNSLTVVIKQESQKSHPDSTSCENCGTFKEENSNEFSQPQCDITVQPGTHVEQDENAINENYTIPPSESVENCLQTLAANHIKSQWLLQPSGRPFPMQPLTVVQVRDTPHNELPKDPVPLTTSMDTETLQMTQMTEKKLLKDLEKCCRTLRKQCQRLTQELQFLEALGEAEEHRVWEN